MNTDAYVFETYLQIEKDAEQSGDAQRADYYYELADTVGKNSFGSNENVRS